MEPGRSRCSRSQRGIRLGVPGEMCDDVDMELRTEAERIAGTLPDDLARIRLTTVDPTIEERVSYQRYGDWMDAAEAELIRAADGDLAALNAACVPCPEVGMNSLADDLLRGAAAVLERAAYPLAEQARELARMCVGGMPARAGVFAHPDVCDAARAALPFIEGDERKRMMRAGFGDNLVSRSEATQLIDSYEERTRARRAR